MRPSRRVTGAAAEGVPGLAMLETVDSVKVRPWPHSPPLFLGRRPVAPDLYPVILVRRAKIYVLGERYANQAVDPILSS